MNPEPTLDQQPEDASAPPTHTEVRMSYAGISQFTAAEKQSELALFGNLQGDPVHLEGTLKEPLRFREAMAALYAVVGSDYRYVPKDRAAYLAFSRLRRDSANLGAWEAQQAYYAWIERNDPGAGSILDPLITVHPDHLLFEVFGKDEGTYANLSIDHEAFHLDGPPSCGTTNIDFSQQLHEGLQQMRSYREAHLKIGQEAVKVRTEGKSEVLEKKIQVPDSWLRGFLQVQTAATLPRDTLKLAPIDLYNLLRHLRLHADQKRQRRGLRFELVPGEFPRIILEPWGTLIQSGQDIYRGKRAKVARVWGRRRLMLLRRILPLVDEAEVHLLGSGLPSFWVLRGRHFTFSLGLTGFTSANWSQAVAFDLLLPRKAEDGKPLEKVVKLLEKDWLANFDTLSERTKLKQGQLHEILQQGCQQGQIMYDLAQDVYRLRRVTDAPLDLKRLEYRNWREKVAHDLLARRSAVKIVTENRILGTGLELTGKVSVQEDKREYRPQLLMDEEGRVVKAECTCNFYRKHGLKEGPCEHILALRLAHAEQEAKRQTEGEPRDTVVTETRTYTKRDEQGELQFQISLDRQRLKIRHGRSHEPMRVQRLQYNSLDDARTAYFRQIDELADRGFLDSTAE